ncbi:uncharacterized protein B0I36DRAFT_329415 [Microdochium trichocladiopsis]|uniref:C2H2-type domain-containing protein n=1 Tax=Microdochium trichocladiopsis TaxID=1682393 RepID=A0A9P9BM40_9PEZI|nr:uncharacterized protein B0I36DRAFT_329415 [Microdochium trichocladiopsis]KAH7025903.1 hypothetical protein B0I36DRAFT_329415 [Microdochium trichocladiopsis]
MTETASSHVVAFGAAAHGHACGPALMSTSHESGSPGSPSAMAQSLDESSRKQSSWRRLRQAKRLRLSDLALKIQHASAPLVELPPPSQELSSCRMFEVSAFDSVSLPSDSDASERTPSARRRALDAGSRESVDESPYFHVRSASEDSCRSGFSGYQDMDRLLISAAHKRDLSSDLGMGEITLHGLAQPHSLVLRPKVYFDRQSQAHDNDTVTTASSRDSFASTSRTSWTMSPPLSPMFGNAVLEQITGANMTKFDPDCPSRPESMISDNTDYFQRHQQDDHPEAKFSERHVDADQEILASGSDEVESHVEEVGEIMAEPQAEVKTESPSDDGVASWEDITQDVDYCEEQKLDKLWDFAVEQFPGLELANSLPILRRRSYVRHFVSQIADTIPDIVMQESDSTSTEPCDGGEQKSSTPNNQGRRESNSSQRNGKRKNQDDEDEDDLDDNLGGNDGDDDGPGPHKRRTRTARTEPADTYDFMCPFRLKDPKKFNVRDHKICALKVFRCNMARKEIGINELRRHIKDEHLLEGLERDPRNQCDRCKVFFKTQSDKEGHVKTGRCEYREHPTSRDPLEGIDIATRDRLVSKKGRQGQHPLKQYHGLCQIIFGDDTEELPHGHKLVREHFELHALYDEHRPKLLSKFQTLLRLGPQGMESLSQILQDHSEGLFESCTKGVPYEVSDIAPLAGKGTPSDRAPSPDQKDSPEALLASPYSHPPQMATDSGIGMSEDGDSCESLIKCSEEMLGLDTSLSGFSGTDSVGPHSYRSSSQPSTHGGTSVSYETLQLGAANMVDPGFRDTLEHRYHVNPNFLQFTDGRPWLRVKDKDNGKTLRYPIRAPVPVQISTSSTIEPPPGPALTQADLVSSAWATDFAPDLPQLANNNNNNFDSFYSTGNGSAEFADQASQHAMYPAYPQPVHHGSHAPMDFLGSKLFPNVGAVGLHDGADLDVHNQDGYVAPSDVYTLTNNNTTVPMYHGQHTFI